MALTEILLSTVLFLYPILFILYILLVTITIILDNKPPEVMMAWLMTMYFLPGIGLILYLLIGINWKRKGLMKQLPERFFKEELKEELSHQQIAENLFVGDIDKRSIKTIRLLNRNSHAIITTRNKFKLLQTGKESFDDILKELKRAKSFIHMEYYIWRSDKLGEKIKKILIEKAKSGVEVRLIFDGWGAFAKIKRAYRKELRENGIKYKYFLNPVSVTTGRWINHLFCRKPLRIWTTTDNL